MDKLIRYAALPMMILAGLTVLGMLVAWSITGTPVYLVAGMSGFAAVGASVVAYCQYRGRRVAA